MSGHADPCWTIHSLRHLVISRDDQRLANRLLRHLEFAVVERWNHRWHGCLSQALALAQAPGCAGVELTGVGVLRNLVPGGSAGGYSSFTLSSIGMVIYARVRRKLCLIAAEANLA